jgi:alpha-beta hydrolase superfamily lysophospholipase
MIHQDGHLQGAAGLRLYRQSWTPEGDVKATVVIAHGASEHSGRYGYVVDRLVADGFAVHSVDHRGHGRSEGPRAFLDRFVNVLSDLGQVVDRAREAHPDRPLFLLGHSMGGGVATAFALRHQSKLDGLALSAPLTVLEAAPLPLRMIARTLSKLAPRTGVYEVEAGGISRDPEEVRRYDEDPLVYRGKLPARTVTELADMVAPFADELPRLTLPLLVMHGTADRIVPIAGAELVAERSGSTDSTFHRYDGFFHELFNEPAGERDRPIGDLAAWLAARAP